MLALHLSMWEVIIGLALFKQTSLYRKMVSLTFMTLVNAALIYQCHAYQTSNELHIWFYVNRGFGKNIKLPCSAPAL